jgi:hypothetical protein
MRAMDRYRSVRGVGGVVQCENGYFAPGETGGGVIYDNHNKKITQFIGEGGTNHAANFIAAVKSRRQADLAGQIEELHVSSSLSHLANISYQLGEQKSNGAITEAVASNEHAREAFGRMVEHLHANEIDVAGTPSVIGPLVQLEKGFERFVTKQDYDVGYWANTMLKREYRKPFVVPEKV